MEPFVRNFIRASLVWLGLGVSLGVAMVIVPQYALVYRPAHMHANLLGFVSMMIFGVAYHVLPRFVGRPLHSSRPFRTARCRKPALAAPTSATPTATHTADCIPLMKASLAASSSGLAASPICDATATAPPIESPATEAASSGRALTTGAIEDE